MIMMIEKMAWVIKYRISMVDRNNPTVNSIQPMTPAIIVYTGARITRIEFPLPREMRKNRVLERIKSEDAMVTIPTWTSPGIITIEKIHVADKNKKESQEKIKKTDENVD